MATIFIIPWKGKGSPVTTLHASARQAGEYRGQIQGSNQNYNARTPGKLMKVDVPDEVYAYFCELLGTKKGIERGITGVIKEASRATIAKK